MMSATREKNVEEVKISPLSDKAKKEIEELEEEIKRLQQTANRVKERNDLSEAERLVRWTIALSVQKVIKEQSLVTCEKLETDKNTILRMKGMLVDLHNTFNFITNAEPL